eukprot:TRINITY_DN5679_c1_g1_i1.p2 TRINITY_DN5679_c1_g1~~TRINITY_DN5679_c1_g1_i1.p2  ORF type:complete len:212 (+),score=-11.76 TRINITY_DN5679_c1_g1_i1:179-814(+)
MKKFKKNCKYVQNIIQFSNKTKKIQQKIVNYKILFIIITSKRLQWVETEMSQTDYTPKPVLNGQILLSTSINKPTKTQTTKNPMVSIIQLIYHFVCQKNLTQYLVNEKIQKKLQICLKYYLIQQQNQKNIIKDCKLQDIIYYYYKQKITVGGNRNVINGLHTKTRTQRLNTTKHIHKQTNKNTNNQKSHGVNHITHISFCLLKKSNSIFSK